MLRNSLPPMNALRTFEVAGRRLSFRAAADEIGVTQGAVAQQIRLLEAHLGLSLFTRLPRGVALTNRGATYHAEISRAFAIMREATAGLDQGDRNLTISVTPTFATKLLIPQLSSLNETLPEVEIRTIATVAVSDFERDQIDIAIRETRPPFPPSLEAVLLFRQEFIIVGSPHLLGKRPFPLTREEASQFPLLHDAYDHWQKYFGTDRKPAGPRFNHIALALDAAMAGQGLAIVSRAFVKADLAAGRLVDAGPAGFEADADYYLVRKKTAEPRPVSDKVWAWCLATFVPD